MLLFAGLALAVAVGLGTAVSPWASPHPDGLERVAEDTGFLGRATGNAIQDEAPVPGYAFPGIADERAATGVAGFAGTIGAFLMALGIGWLLRRRRGSGPQPAPPSTTSRPPGRSTRSTSQRNPPRRCESPAGAAATTASRDRSAAGSASASPSANATW